MSSRAGPASPARSETAYNPDNRSSKNYLQLRMDLPPILSVSGPFFPWYPSWPDTAFFQKTVIRRKYRFRFGDLSELTVKSLDGIRGIDQAADRFGILEIRWKIRPVILPRFCDFRIFPRSIFHQSCPVLLMRSLLLGLHIHVSDQPSAAWVPCRKQTLLYSGSGGWYTAGSQYPGKQPQLPAESLSGRLRMRLGYLLRRDSSIRSKWKARTSHFHFARTIHAEHVFMPFPLCRFPIAI